MSRPDKCKISFTQLFYEVSIIHFKAPLTIFSRRRRQLFYWPQNYDERFWTWKLCKSKSTSLGDLLNTILSIYCFLWTFFLAFTATLGNTLILIALHKVSSIHPPTKCLLHCLAMSDFCVGVIVQPLFAALLMGIASGNWRIIYFTLSFF